MEIFSIIRCLISIVRFSVILINKMEIVRKNKQKWPSFCSFFFLACIFCPHPQSNMSVNIRNLMVITYYSGTCAIRHRSFPTSCDIRQFYGPKVFMLTKIKPEYSDILYHPTHSLVPWCVGLDRFHCICLNELKFYLLPKF